MPNLINKQIFLVANPGGGGVPLIAYNCFLLIKGQGHRPHFEGEWGLALTGLSTVFDPVRPPIPTLKNVDPSLPS